MNLKLNKKINRETHQNPTALFSELQGRLEREYGDFLLDNPEYHAYLRKFGDILTSNLYRAQLEENGYFEQLVEEALNPEWITLESEVETFRPERHGEEEACLKRIRPDEPSQGFARDSINNSLTTEDLVRKFPLPKIWAEFVLLHTENALGVQIARESQDTRGDTTEEFWPFTGVVSGESLASSNSSFADRLNDLLAHREGRKNGLEKPPVILERQTELFLKSICGGCILNEYLIRGFILRLLKKNTALGSRRHPKPRSFASFASADPEEELLLKFVSYGVAGKQPSLPARDSQDKASTSTMTMKAIQAEPPRQSLFIPRLSETLCGISLEGGGLGMFKTFQIFQTLFGKEHVIMTPVHDIETYSCYWTGPEESRRDEGEVSGPRVLILSPSDLKPPDTKAWIQQSNLRNRLAAACERRYNGELSLLAGLSCDAKQQASSDKKQDKPLSPLELRNEADLLHEFYAYLKTYHPDCLTRTIPVCFPCTLYPERAQVLNQFGCLEEISFLRARMLLRKAPSTRRVADIANWALQTPESHQRHYQRTLFFRSLWNGNPFMLCLTHFIQCHFRRMEGGFVAGHDLKAAFIQAFKNEPLGLDIKHFQKISFNLLMETLSHVLEAGFDHKVRIGRPTEKGPRPYGLFGIDCPRAGYVPLSESDFQDPSQILHILPHFKMTLPPGYEEDDGIHWV